MEIDRKFGSGLRDRAQDLPLGLLRSWPLRRLYVVHYDLVRRNAPLIEGFHRVGHAHVHGVERDEVEADTWFTLLAAGGKALAASYRDDLERQMTPKQAAEAKKRAGEWKPVSSYVRGPSRAVSAVRTSIPESGAVRAVA